MTKNLRMFLVITLCFLFSVVNVRSYKNEWIEVYRHASNDLIRIDYECVQWSGQSIKKVISIVRYFASICSKSDNEVIVKLKEIIDNKAGDKYSAQYGYHFIKDYNTVHFILNLLKEAGAQNHQTKYYHVFNCCHLEKCSPTIEKCVRKVVRALSD